MWRFFKRAAVFTLILLVLAVLFRGPLFRAFFHFEHLQVRASGTPVVRDVPERLRNYAPVDEDVDACIDAALHATAQALDFSTDRVPGDALGALNTGKANCIGYAAVFQLLCTDRLADAALANDWQVIHMRGLLYCGSFNMHRLFSSPFWKDHDICMVQNRATGERIYVDPTLYDALRISRVRGPAN